MQESYAGGYNHFLLHAIPLTFVIGLVFFLLGLGVGWLLWRRYKSLAEQAELEHMRLFGVWGDVKDELKRAASKADL